LYSALVSSKIALAVLTVDKGDGMVRESLQERFLEALAGLGGSAGNGKLQAELGWQDATYGRVQSALLDDGLIVKGRGRGGSVALADHASQEPQEPMEQPKPQSPAPRPPTPARASNGSGSSFEQIFKNIDDVLWKEKGCNSELDYTEQTSWMLFLKYLDDLDLTLAIFEISL
jgi:type I restriction enzyme M protein